MANGEVLEDAPQAVPQSCVMLEDGSLTCWGFPVPLAKLTPRQ